MPILNGTRFSLSVVEDIENNASLSNNLLRVFHKMYMGEEKRKMRHLGGWFNLKSNCISTIFKKKIVNNFSLCQIEYRTSSEAGLSFWNLVQKPRHLLVESSLLVECLPRLPFGVLNLVFPQNVANLSVTRSPSVRPILCRYLNLVISVSFGEMINMFVIFLTWL